MLLGHLTSAGEPACGQRVSSSASGALVAVCGGPGTPVRVWRVDGDGAQVDACCYELPHTDAPAFGVQFSPTRETMLAVASKDSHVYLCEVGSHPPSRLTLTGHADAVRDVAFAPSGATLASVGHDKVPTRKLLC